MLLRFGASNFRSISGYQEISLVAASIKDSGADLISVPGFKIKVLPSIGIYGANAAGKSSFLDAIQLMCSLVEISHQKLKPGTVMPRQPFALDPALKDQSSQLDCDFIKDGNRYHYGFSYDAQGIIEEWLYQFSLGGSRTTKKTFFHRNRNEKKKFYFGAELKGANRSIEQLTRDNSLFLSAAASNNHQQLLPIYDFFANECEFRDAESAIPPTRIAKFLLDESTRAQTLKFLGSADIGIVGLSVKKTEEDEKSRELRADIAAVIKKFAGAESEIDLNGIENYDLSILHRGVGDSEPELNFFDESNGTRALLSILGPVFEVLKTGRCLFLDELNTNLHPIVSRNLVSLFNSSETNPKGAQLLFTTHDTNLLCGGILRRDQIWFTEKDGQGASHIYPLTNIHTKGTDNISKGYLEGRFGAIPFLANWKGNAKNAT